MAEKAEIIDTAENDAVCTQSRRLPDGRREVIIQRDGRRLVLNPLDGWPMDFLEVLGSVDEELERLPQTPITELEDPFA